MSDRLLLLIGTSKGLFIDASDRARKQWNLRGPLLPGWEIDAVHADPSGRILVGTSHPASGATVRVSDDLGETWRRIEAGPAFPQGSGEQLTKIWQITDGPEPGTLLAGAESPGLFLSRDRGESWSEIAALRDHPTRSSWSGGNCPLCVHSILTDRANPRRLWVAVSAAGILRSDDGGASWCLCNRGLPPIKSDASGTRSKIQKLAQDPHEADLLYMQNHVGAFRSADGGENWGAINNGLPTNFGFPICVAGNGDVFLTPLLHEGRHFKDGKVCVGRLRRGADRWEILDRGLPAEPHFVGVLRDAMCADPLEEPGVYFGTSAGQLFYSRDSGQAWEELPTRLSRVTSMRTSLAE